jgi:hypothetical protein
MKLGTPAGVSLAEKTDFCEVAFHSKMVLVTLSSLAALIFRRKRFVTNMQKLL